MRFEKYKLCELCKIVKVKGLSFDTYKEGKIPYVTGSSSNNGVVGYVSASIEAISKGNCIAVDPIKGFAYYQPIDFVGRGFSGASINLLYIEDLDEFSALYICSSIEKVSTKVASYAHLFNSDRLANAEIILPTKEDGYSLKYSKLGYIPDFKYMRDRIKELERSRIKELERSRIKELERYLMVTGLNDYELTSEDKAILSLSTESTFNEDRDNENVMSVSRQYREFRIGDLFTKKTLKGFSLKGKGLIEDSNGYPVYGQNIKWQYSYKVRLDEKYLHRVDSEHPILAYTSSVGEIGMIDEDFYRSGDNGAFQGLFPKNSNSNKYTLLYILSVLRKQFLNFGYSTGMSNVLEISFLLPIKVDNFDNPIIDTICQYHKDGYIPDFDYMEKYIKAIQKIVIADVVKFKDREIEKMKEIVIYL